MSNDDERPEVDFNIPPMGTITLDGDYMRPSFVADLIVLCEREEAESESPEATAHWAKTLAFLYDLAAKL